MARAKKRSVGLSKVAQTPPLLKFIKHRPVQEPESIEAPPLTSSDEEVNEDQGYDRAVLKTPTPSRKVPTRQLANKGRRALSSLGDTLDTESISDSDSDSDRDGAWRRASIPRIVFGNKAATMIGTRSTTTRSSISRQQPAAQSSQIPPADPKKRKRYAKDSSSSSLSEPGSSDVDNDKAQSVEPPKPVKATPSEPFSEYREREAVKRARTQVTYGKKQAVIRDASMLR